MKLEIKVTAVKVNSRFAKGKTPGDLGEIKHSVDIFGFSADGFPAQFVMYGLPSAESAKATAAKYPSGVTVVASVAPRDPYFVSDEELSVTPEAKK